MASPGICEYWATYILAYITHRAKLYLTDVDILSLKTKHIPDISVAPRTNMCKFLIRVIHTYYCKLGCERKVQHANRIWQSWMGILLRASMSLDGYPIEQILRTTPAFLELRETFEVCLGKVLGQGSGLPISSYLNQDGIHRTSQKRNVGSQEPCG
jgi:hypothetical protein